MSEADPTAAELLTAVNVAISTLLTRRVKSYRVAGVEYTYSDLSELRAMRRDLQQECRTTGNQIRLADMRG